MEYKRYKAVFFDWDGTAVLSRKAPVQEAAAAMGPLLRQGIRLVIVSGTTMENIAGGELEKYFTKEELNNLYLGLGRGAFNYAFRDGEPYVFSHMVPDEKGIEKIHRACFEVHMGLKRDYGFDTDIVFSRPNYCKIDLMPEAVRGDNLFMQEDELWLLREKLAGHGIRGGLKALMALAEEAGREQGLKVKPTCDAKYLEVGISDKSDNVTAVFRKLEREIGLKAEECAFWGDEFVGIEEGIYGSDSFMITELTAGGDFFDVSEVPGERPEGVNHSGGGVKRFLDFLSSRPV